MNKTSISYWGKPIKKLVHDGMPIEYCVWRDGFRLISVNGFASHLLNNCIFSHFLEVVLNHEKNTIKKDI